MKTLIQFRKDGRFFVAEDNVTNVADQGLTGEEAVSNLRKGLEEHYRVFSDKVISGE
jgi:predicted RNase H-like HicB family nuclease